MIENPYEHPIPRRVPKWILEMLTSPNQARHDAWNKGSDFVINLLEKAGTDGIDSLSDEGIEGKLKDWLKRIYNQALKDAEACLSPQDSYLSYREIRALKKESP